MASTISHQLISILCDIENVMEYPEEEDLMDHYSFYFDLYDEQLPFLDLQNALSIFQRQDDVRVHNYLY